MAAQPQQNQNVRFIRINGRVVPVRQKNKTPSTPVLTGAAVGGAVGAAGASATVAKRFEKNKKKAIFGLESQFTKDKKAYSDFLSHDLDEAANMTKYSFEKSANPLKPNSMDEAMGFTKAKGMYADYLKKKGLDAAKANTEKSAYNLLNLVTKTNIKNNKIRFDAQTQAFQKQSQLYKSNLENVNKIFSKQNKVKFKAKGGLFGLAVGAGIGAGLSYIVGET